MLTWYQQQSAKATVGMSVSLVGHVCSSCQWKAESFSIALGNSLTCSDNSKKEFELSMSLEAI